MLTIKQLETFVQVVELGTFERAAKHLYATQSTISKRISELEAASGLQLFDRSKRTARLTEDGERLYGLAKDTLSNTDKILRLKGDPESPFHKIRIGVTDLAALTWLPKFLQECSYSQPRIKFEVTIEMSRTLAQMFVDGDLDLIVAPLETNILRDTKAQKIKLREIELALVGQSSLVSSPKPIALKEIEQYKILGQGKQSTFAQFINKWLFEHGVQLTPTMIANNLLAHVGLISAGHGVAILPKRCLLNLAGSADLVEIATIPKLPSIEYYIFLRDESRGNLLSKVALEIQKNADFTKPFFV
ncbi:MAG: LysR family transcriptional regulator [Amphritea sp.]|nr:LysR family transcriptional regulator [Amphritea sp.]